MLVLSRKEDQSIIFPNLGISIEIVRVQGNKVSVGVEAPKAIRIVRGELQTAAEPSSKDGSSKFQLGQIIELLAPEARQELRSRLDVAGLAVHAAQKQCELNSYENVEFFLRKAIEALQHLNQMLELPQSTDSSNCVKESPSTYRHATAANCLPTTDRCATGWFSQPCVSHPQLIEYLQHQLCSSN